MQRRHFLQTAGLSLAASGLSTLSAAEKADPEKARRPRAIFTKFLEKLSPDELAALIAKQDVTGLEAPLRPGGHIKPENTAAELPAFLAALAKKDLKVEIAASGVNELDDAGKNETYLRALAANGVTRYRLQHFRYDLSKSIPTQMADIRAKLIDLAALNKELGLQGQYQNHRGDNYVGGPIWDMVEILKDIDSQQLGMAFDVAHAAVEGTSAWRMNLRRAAPHIAAIYFKDYALKGRRWQTCPLGEGIVDPKVAEEVADLLPADLPVSVHIEYLNHKAPDHLSQVDQAMTRDLATLRKWLPH
ncbi:MAG: sugar phosphate isomerase/epimerase family protein [Verrucomicrobiales bacterium]